MKVGWSLRRLRVWAPSAVAQRNGYTPCFLSTAPILTGGRSYDSKWFGLATGAGLAVVLTSTTGVVCDEAKPAPVDYAQVRKDIADILDNDKHDDGSYGPIIVRLAWNSSGSYDGTKYSKCIGGSNGGTMRFKPECDFEANAGLAIARSVLDPIKAKYTGLSYGDLWTLAAVVAIEEMGGPSIPWRAGRVDAPDSSSCPPDGRLPDASQGPRHIRDIFYRMGFNDKEIVALIGAHALGRCHKNISGFYGPWTRSPTTFSNEFYRVLIAETWSEKQWSGPKQFQDKSGTLTMLPTDMALLDDPSFKKYVELFAKDEAEFFKEFSKAFSKLMEFGVKFPSKGWLSWILSFIIFW